MQNTLAKLIPCNLCMPMPWSLWISSPGSKLGRWCPRWEEHLQETTRSRYLICADSVRLYPVCSIGVSFTTNISIPYTEHMGIEQRFFVGLHCSYRRSSNSNEVVSNSKLVDITGDSANGGRRGPSEVIGSSNARRMGVKWVKLDYNIWSRTSSKPIDCRWHVQHKFNR